MKRIIDHSVSIITIKKNDKMYGMTCAWAMQCGYNELLALVGSQSKTGEIVSENDLIAFNVLDNEQKNLALLFGEHHSDEVEKFANVYYNVKDSAVLIKGCASSMICKVKEIIHLKGLEDDNLLYLEILSVEECSEKPFLHMSDF